ncbi:MAG: hypothetical protein AB3X44_02495 [Leptothrix sp. (in: b-proteobacteria)]
MRDCLFLVADKNMEGILKGYLSRPGIHAALGCGPFTFDARRDLHVAHGQNDPGLYTRAKEFLQPYAKSHRHAAVVMDAEWDGSPGTAEIERRLTDHLTQAGWPPACCCAVVITPELENWVWQDTPHVSEQLGFNGTYSELRHQLERKGYWRAGESKPHRPKEAVEEVLRLNKIPRSSAIYRDLAARIKTSGCTDSAFLKLRDAMRQWFPVQSS